MFDEFHNREFFEELDGLYGEGKGDDKGKSNVKNSVTKIFSGAKKKFASLTSNPDIFSPETIAPAISVNSYSNKSLYWSSTDFKLVPSAFFTGPPLSVFGASVRFAALAADDEAGIAAKSQEIEDLKAALDGPTGIKKEIEKEKGIYEGHAATISSTSSDWKSSRDKYIDELRDH